jgi:hypothetical protein
MKRFKRTEFSCNIIEWNVMGWQGRKGINLAGSQSKNAQGLLRARLKDKQSGLQRSEKLVQYHVKSFTGSEEMLQHFQNWVKSIKNTHYYRWVLQLHRKEDVVMESSPWGVQKEYSEKKSAHEIWNSHGGEYVDVVLVDRNQRFGGIYCPHLQDWIWGQCVPPNRWYLGTSPDCVTAQKTTTDSTDSADKSINKWF